MEEDGSCGAVNEKALAPTHSDNVPSPARATKWLLSSFALFAVTDEEIVEGMGDGTGDPSTSETPIVDGEANVSESAPVDGSGEKPSEVLPLCFHLRSRSPFSESSILREHSWAGGGIDRGACSFLRGKGFHLG